MVIRVYWASVTSNRKVTGDQTRLRYILESNNIESLWIDITTNSIVRNRMREECCNPTALPPQIFNENVHLGNVDDLNDSIEDGRLMEWLQIESKTQTNSGNETQNAALTKPSSSADDLVTVKSVICETAESKQSNFTTKSEIIVPGKSVSSAVSEFENIKKSPQVSRKTITLQLANDNGNSHDSEAEKEKTKMDEERKRRILGLQIDSDEKDTAEINCLQDKTNENGTVGVKRYDASDPKMFEGVRNVSNEVKASTTNEINHS